MKVTIEANGYKIVVTEDMFERFNFSLPRDVLRDGAGVVTLGRAHLMVGGQFKDGVTPEWVKA